MSHPAVGAPANAGPTGLIDTLQAGFNTVNRHLWLLLLPLIVDLSLWLGPQLTVGPAVSDWLSNPASDPAVGVILERILGESDRAVLVPAQEIRRYNMLWLLALPFLGVPSYSAGAIGGGVAVALDSFPALALTAGVIVVLGLSLAVLYYGLLAHVVRNGTAAVSSFAADFGPLWVRAASLFLISSAAALLFAVPAAVLLTAAQTATPTLLILASLVLGVGVWLFVPWIMRSVSLRRSGAPIFVFSSVRPGPTCSAILFLLLGV